MSIKLRVEHTDDATGQAVVAERRFDEPVISIGSHAAATLHLASRGLAAEQALIFMAAGQCFLINRAEGTALNDEALPPGARQLIHHRDRIRVGEYLIEVILDESADESPYEEGEPLEARLNGHRANGAAAAADTAPLPVTAQTEVIDKPKSFSAILDGLRTIEDSFYFVLRGGPHAGQRIPIRDAEMMVGWDESFQALSFDPAQIATPCARVRKDWSGVMIEPQGEAGIMLNGKPMTMARRLRDNDEVGVGALVGEQAIDNLALVFHEPASLVVLDSLLPNRLPPPVTRLLGTNGHAAAPDVATPAPAAADTLSENHYFGHFSARELLMMVIGTLILAAMVFLLLESL